MMKPIFSNWYFFLLTIFTTILNLILRIIGEVIWYLKFLYIMNLTFMMSTRTFLTNTLAYYI